MVCRLSDPNIVEFVFAHLDDDVRALALKKSPYDDWPYIDVLDQIKSRQKLRMKMPDWSANRDLIAPSPFVVEQASSFATASFKASLFAGERVVDLTAGAGVDSYLLGSGFERLICVEHDRHSADILRHNMAALLGSKAKIVQVDAENFVQDMEPADLVYIDPGRRDGVRKGKFALADCSPNILEMLPILAQKTKAVLVKTSPFLDISGAIAAFEEAGCTVPFVYVLEWRGDCKEVLYHLSFAPEACAETEIKACILGDNGSVQASHVFVQAQEHSFQPNFSMPVQYLYEPSAAVMKSGGFHSLAAAFDVTKLHAHSHLYSSDMVIKDFPGRCFHVEGVFPVQAKALPFRQANLTVRNFPASVDVLKKRLKLKDGGDDYLFATTLCDDSKALVHCRKLGHERT